MSGGSLAIVDDQPLMVTALRQLISRSTDFQIVAVGTAAVDIVSIASKYRPQCFIVDPGFSAASYDAIARAVKIAPETKFIAFTASTLVETAIRALDAGVKGYVLKGSKPAELLAALDCGAEGEVYVSQYFASRVIATLRDKSLRRAAAEAVKLSVRENQIVTLLLRGRTNREIATTLHISERTVKHYMTVLMQKLQVRSRIEVVLAAQQLERGEYGPRAFPAH